MITFFDLLTIIEFHRKRIIELSNDIGYEDFIAVRSELARLMKTAIISYDGLNDLINDLQRLHRNMIEENEKK